MYQQAVKMVKNICSMQIPYSGLVLCVDTSRQLHSIGNMYISFVNLSIHPADFLRILIQKRFVF